MDKNNDIQVNKVSKWEAAPENIGKLKHDLRFLLDRLEVRTYDVDDPEYKELVDEIFKGLDKALDDYNELEARHQKDTGMISEYEEENKKLKSKLDIMTDENDCLIDRVFNQDEEYSKLEADHKKLQETHELCMKAHLRLCDDCTKLATENDDLRQERDKCSYRLEKLGKALEERGIYCRWFEASLEWHLYEGESFEELNRKIQRLEKEKVDKDKLIEELTHENMVLKLKNYSNKTYGLTGKIELLNKEIDDLKIENKNLKYFKDVQERNEVFGKYVGKSVAESIREGWEHNLYKLHPYTRIDIHVEQIEDMPFAFNHCAIPNVSVTFNNSQTEMERDTAQHECEELNRKIKGLTKENKELKSTLVICERDANTARNLCHNIAFNAGRAKSKTPWFNDAYEEEK